MSIKSAMCGNKRKYNSFAQSTATAEHGYRCPFCKKFHSTFIGSQSQTPTQKRLKAAQRLNPNLIYLSDAERFAQRQLGKLIGEGANVRLLYRNDQYEIHIK